MVFHWNVIDITSPLVSRTLLNILAGVNSAVIYLVSMISTSSSFLTIPLGNRSKCTNYNWYIVNFMLPGFFSFLANSKYLSLFFNFHSVICKVNYTASFFGRLIIDGSGHLAWISWSFIISESQGTLYVSFLLTDSSLCIYYLVVWSNFNFLHNSLYIIFPILSFLFLYSRFDRLLHSFFFFLWSIFPSLSPHNQHLLIYCILSIFALT